MSVLEDQIEIGAAPEVVWDRLHEVSAYPQFVDGVRGARREGAHRARLDIEAGGRRRGCDAEFSDRGGGRVMMWHTTEGPDLEGAFSVRQLADGGTEVQVRVRYDPDRTREEFGGPRGFAQSDAIHEMVHRDLERLKALVERER
ncbi:MULTISPECIES: SRPBCC family protein [Streptomycetaceae]|uniref:Cyclase/dehydrase n=1 Tax=Streptantibioticus cattleyicolor (strain ATCC 35852 / DSM 46488 / JCM 4925 / NBRC 14057 / NRRL 8057) TaxID=1003195 RepID=F8JSS6_STREN|nr:MULTISPECIES: SRPBCC family protein [Streptomycetaceae]AEW97982.1 cyclase/dehydrase [Streptantibioticus cattleyicolor NRRL 8057 = DSM 46488]MYS62382.1 cyclase [Streptomyces sp. SID5468]CCB78300.1 protein of unknown function [Streptantibioticus cattleyicolor NRRL 8057 = DSM 46488]